MLEIKNLNFYYGNNHILKNISFNAESGSLWGLMGPNGSGKTTLSVNLAIKLAQEGDEVLLIDYRPTKKHRSLYRHNDKC